MLAHILLAAGLGTRLGHQPKALLNYKGQSFIRHTLSEMLRAEPHSITVVLGAYAHAVLKHLADEELPSLDAKVAVVIHENYAEGQLSSLQAGIRALPRHCRGVLVSLVDLPQLMAEDFHSLHRLWIDSGETGLIRPYYGSEPQHPVIIGSSFFQEILLLEGTGEGAASIFRKYSDKTIKPQWNHRRGAADVDTLADYASYSVL